jgi:hypothetical protein
MAEQNILRQDPYMRDGEIDERVLEKISDYVQGGNIPPMFFRKNQGISSNILGLLQNRTTQEQVDPYAYGSYVIPASDPTYTSGFNYARTIAGGMPFEDVVAPGMSFSPEQPGGYTQADLNVVNLPRDVAPVFPTPPATTGEVFEPTQPTMPDAPPGTPMPFPLPNFFGSIPKFDPSKLQNFSGIKLFDFDPSKFLQSTPSEENNLGIPNFSIETAAPRTDVGAILDSEGRLNEQYGSNLKNFIPSMPQPTDPTINPINNISVTPPADAVFSVPPTMTPPAFIPSEIPSRGGLLQMPTTSPITPNINFQAPVVQKPVMPKTGGFFPSVGRGISAVRGAQEGFDEFKEGLKKKAISGLFGIG